MKTRGRTGPEGIFVHLGDKMVSYGIHTRGIHCSSSFAPFWAPGGALGSLLEPRGASWGRLGRLLRASWGPLGASAGLPGGLLERIGALLLGDQILAPKRVPKGRHFGSQHGTKIVPKSKSKMKTKNRSSWEPLGSILGRFGGQVGAKKYQNSLVGLPFREK